MTRPRLLLNGLASLLLLAMPRALQARTPRHVERDGWILRPEDD